MSPLTKASRSWEPSSASSCPEPAWTTLEVASQPSGPDVAVLVVGSLRVDAGQTFTANGALPLAIVAASAILLDGDMFIASGGALAASGDVSWGGLDGNGLGAGKAGMNGMYAGGGGGGSFYDAGSRR